MWLLGYTLKGLPNIWGYETVTLHYHIADVSNMVCFMPDSIRTCRDGENRI